MKKRRNVRIVELEASVEARFAQHRGVVRGEQVDDNRIKEILRASDDLGERREAWEASKTIGAAVADDVRELARLRNEAARTLGHRDWFALAVAISEMDEARLFATLAECDSLTAEPFVAWKATTDAAIVPATPIPAQSAAAARTILAAAGTARAAPTSTNRCTPCAAPTSAGATTAGPMDAAASTTAGRLEMPSVD